MSASATLGGGCFWCLEAAFRPLKGVVDVVPGYAGGHVENPSYEQVSTGTTGHAEVVRVEYDPDAITYEQLLDVFFAVHDPTTKDRQGADVGPQYRSIVLYEDEAQKEVALRKIRALSGLFKPRIVTEVKPLERFWPAEPEHHRYYDKYPQDPYCQAVIAPKVRKVVQSFRPLLK
ncbi:peptide methionine sulfoxide reductase [Oceanithermus profundus DSM 14977]|uniref:Peptide methionine sulfoxide reductase MsrA n=1 Tax=Oceanithermus profundus (strain DSM 14977 / NBRC 100410 / VKM B-2274 / 506) TaxID=670487 RepID=E4UA44_OCEP5|nr:peptide-methionine (S)-S-oxide reductase MsrA [Oceanithermus profundus]ADR37421.1 peptide methionine sulfoxide reductase [Oceanithermus profundus DSM 14977]